MRSLAASHYGAPANTERHTGNQPDAIANFANHAERHLKRYSLGKNCFSTGLPRGKREIFETYGKQQHPSVSLVPQGFAN